MTTVVKPHKAPAAKPNKSPVALPLPMLSRMANATATKAQASPSHCSGRRRSDFTNKGTSAATQKGAVYKKMVNRDAVVSRRPR